MFFAHFLLSGFLSSDLELSKSLFCSTGRPHYKSFPDSLQVLLRILAKSLYTSPQMQRPIIVSDALRYNFIYLFVVVWYKYRNYNIAFQTKLQKNIGFKMLKFFVVVFNRIKLLIFSSINLHNIL